MIGAVVYTGSRGFNMGGLMSRRKGATAERALCMQLRLLGYDARRVIRTRAVSGFEGDIVPDVEVWENGEVKYTFESKARQNAYSKIYELYEKEKMNGVCRFVMNGQFVAIGTDFEEVKKPHDVHFIRIEETPSTRKLFGLRKLLKGAMFLVIRDNRKKPLFLRFWGT